MIPLLLKFVLQVSSGFVPSRSLQYDRKLNTLAHVLEGGTPLPETHIMRYTPSLAQLSASNISLFYDFHSPKYTVLK